MKPLRSHVLPRRFAADADVSEFRGAGANAAYLPAFTELLDALLVRTVSTGRAA